MQDNFFKIRREPMKTLQVMCSSNQMIFDDVSVMKRNVDHISTSLLATTTTTEKL